MMLLGARQCQESGLSRSRALVARVAKLIVSHCRADGVFVPNGTQSPGTPSHRPRPSLDSVRHWNEIAIDASGINQSLIREQFGPTRVSRAMATPSSVTGFRSI